MDGVLSKSSSSSFDEEAAVVVVLGVTSRPEDVDPAMLRPGRLGEHVLVPQPDQAGREKILLEKMARMPVELGGSAFSDKVSLAAELARATDGCSGADLSGICREAAMLALRADLKSGSVRPMHFLQAAGTAPAT